MNEQITPERAALDAVQKNKSDIEILSTGYRAILKPVPAPLFDSATSRIKDPVVPKWFNEEKGREEENPFHPEYLAAKAEAERLRGLAGMDVMIIAGVQLVDPIPPTEEWLPTLKMLEKLGHLDISKFDLNDPVEKEFVFKKYVAVGQDDYALIAKRSRILPEEVESAERSFRS